jgi:hypothetical protein
MLPGDYGLTVNGITCSGSFDVRTDQRTHAVVQIAEDGGCVVAAVSYGVLPTP